MAKFAQRWRSFVRTRRAFADADDGVAAVEFALIAAPFFFMLFAVLEVAIVFFSGAALENATADASRQIRTGVFQAGGGGEQEFKDLVCDGAGMLIDCDKLTLDVRTYSNFSEVDLSSPIKDGELDDDNFAFSPGSGGQIVLVRVFYERPVIMPYLGGGSASLSGNRRLMTSTVAFRNEPF